MASSRNLHKFGNIVSWLLFFFLPDFGNCEMESGQANRNITKNSDLELNPCKFHESGYTAYYTDLMMGGWLGQKN